MAKLRQGEKRVQLSFQRPEDVSLFAFMEKRAYECRWDLPTFIVAALQDAFRGQVKPEPQYPGLSGEPINQEPFRPIPADPPPAIIVSDEPLPLPKATPQTESTDDGYEATKAAIARDTELFRKKGKVSRKVLIPGADDTVPASPPVSPK